MCLEALTLRAEATSSALMMSIAAWGLRHLLGVTFLPFSSTSNNPLHAGLCWNLPFQLPSHGEPIAWPLPLISQYSPMPVLQPPGVHAAITSMPQVMPLA